MKFHTPYVLWLIIVFIPNLSGCGTTLEKSAMKTITGEILFDESTNLPENAQITVSLEDVSGLDIASGVMVVKEFTPAGPPPYKFSLEYNSNWINPSGEYAVRARIDVDGKFTFSGIKKINKEKKEGFLQVQVERIDFSD